MDILTNLRQDLFLLEHNDYQSWEFVVFGNTLWSVGRQDTRRNDLSGKGAYVV